MKIIVTGGGGVIGRHLCTELAKLNHEVHAIDMFFDATEMKNVTMHVADVTQPNFLSMCFRLTPNVIIHLAEMASAGSLSDALAAQNNIGTHAQVLNACAKLGIRGIIGEWPLLYETNLLEWSLDSKKEMKQFFDRGNCVVNQIYIPFLLDPNLPSSHFCNVIGRVWDNISLGTRIYIDEGERGSLDSSLTTVCTVQEVTSAFIDQLDHNTRRPHDVQGEPTALPDLIGTALDVFDVDSVTIYGRNDPYECRRAAEPNAIIHNWIKQLWTEPE